MSSRACVAPCDLRDADGHVVHERTLTLRRAPERLRANARQTASTDTHRNHADRLLTEGCWFESNLRSHIIYQALRYSYLRLLATHPTTWSFTMPVACMNA